MRDRRTTVAWWLTQLFLWATRIDNFMALWLHKLLQLNDGMQRRRLRQLDAKKSFLKRRAVVTSSTTTPAVALNDDDVINSTAQRRRGRVMRCNRRSCTCHIPSRFRRTMIGKTQIHGFKESIFHIILQCLNYVMTMFKYLWDRPRITLLTFIKLT